MENLIRNIIPEYHINTADDIDGKEINVEKWFSHCETLLTHLAKTTQHASEELKWYVETLPLNTIIYSIYRNLNVEMDFCIVSLKHLIEALHCNITYDYYNEFCNVAEVLEDNLAAFCNIEINRKKLIDLLPECDEMWKKMTCSENEEAKTVAERELEDSKIFHKDLERIQMLVQLHIRGLIQIIDDVRKYRFYRKDEELEIIYNYHLHKYRTEIFPRVWEKFRQSKLDHDFKYHSEIKSVHWVEVKNTMWHKFTATKLGELYSNNYMDGVVVLANKICRENVPAEMLNDYFYNICLQDALDDEIISLREQEMNADPDFRMWVDLVKLKDFLWAWIKVNIKNKYQWAVVICVFHELRLLREDCTPNKLAIRLNALFPEAEKECTIESVRKFVGNKWDKEKECNQPINTWSENNSIRPLAMDLLNKMSDKGKYRKIEE